MEGGQPQEAARVDVSAKPTRAAYVVRHAHAGDRAAWHGDDNQRPLSDKGRRQAEAIATVLAQATPTPRRIRSSPSLRCMQTLEPLARALHLRVDSDDSLLEGADPRDALDMLQRELHDGATVAACTHGDIVPGLLDLLRSEGVRIDGQLTWPKASTWVFDADDDGRVVAARYLPPP
jgi:phosphohistidine phosphatase SixA